MASSSRHSFGYRATSAVDASRTVETTADTKLIGGKD